MYNTYNTVFVCIKNIIIILFNKEHSILNLSLFLFSNMALLVKSQTSTKQC